MEIGSINIVTPGHHPVRQNIQTRLLPYSRHISAAQNLTTAIERLIKLLDNREEMDVSMVLLQSALGKRINSKALGKHDQ